MPSRYRGETPHVRARVIDLDVDADISQLEAARTLPEVEACVARTRTALTTVAVEHIARLVTAGSLSDGGLVDYLHGNELFWEQIGDAVAWDFVELPAAEQSRLRQSAIQLIPPTESPLDADDYVIEMIFRATAADLAAAYRADVAHATGIDLSASASGHGPHSPFRGR